MFVDMCLGWSIRWNTRIHSRFLCFLSASSLKFVIFVMLIINSVLLFLQWDIRPWCFSGFVFISNWGSQPQDDWRSHAVYIFEWL